MTEGVGGALDKPQQRPYQERPLSPADQDRVESRMRGFPAGIGSVVGQLRDAKNPLGQRFAIKLGMFGRPTTPEEALVQAGDIVASAREDGSFLRARTPADLKWSPYLPVEEFDPAEIGRVHEEIRQAKAGNAMDSDTRFVGFIDASQEGGWTLGVVDTEEHTVTRLPHQNVHGHY